MTGSTGETGPEGPAGPEGSVALERGEELELVDAEGAPLGALRFGIGWDRQHGAGAAGTGAPDVDLDATAVQFADGQLFDLAFYNNLTTRDGSVVHHGDNQTGRGEGDDETVDVDLSRVHGPVDRILLMVSSYQGHTLEWIAHAYCRVVVPGRRHDGTPAPDRDVELARVTLTLGVPETGLVMARLARQGDRWHLSAVGEGVAITVPTQGLQKLQRFL